MQSAYKIIDEYQPDKECKVLIDIDDIVSDIVSS